MELNLVVWLSTAKLTFLNVRTPILYHTTKFKSTDSGKNVVWGKTAKFNDRQYFWLYDTLCMLARLILNSIVLIASSPGPFPAFQCYKAGNGLGGRGYLAYTHKVDECRSTTEEHLQYSIDEGESYCHVLRDDGPH